MTSALLDAPPRRIGAEEARVFTPPLPQHVNVFLSPDAVCERCNQRHINGIDCAHTYGYQCIDFLESVLRWSLLPWQRWLYVHALEKNLAGTGFRFKTLCILVARQNGKSKWLRGLGLWRLFLDKLGRADKRVPSAKLALIAMQGLDYAESMLAEANQDIVECRPLKREWVRHHVANGKHRIVLKGRRYWRATTANRKGGRSFSVDLACLDELREHHSWDAYSAITPTVVARPFGMVVCTSNAGESHSIVLRSLRTTAMRAITAGRTDTAQLGLFEWSVPDDVDVTNTRYWHMANPAMGHDQTGLTLEGLQGQFESMQFDALAKFQTEHLCMWVDALDPGIIPAEAWHDTMDATSCRASKSEPVYACVDVNFQRTKAYVVVAYKRADGTTGFEVAAAARGTDWIVPWFQQRAGKFEAVVVQKIGAPASNLIKPLQDAGVPVREWGGSDLTQGTQTFYDKIVQGRAKHRPAASLDRAAAATIAKPVADSFLLDRRNSPVDAAPLCAAAGAVWAEDQGPTPEDTPALHSWPDDETISRWQRGED